MAKSKRYFGWAGPEPFDDRDYPYSVGRAVLAALPPAVDLRPRFRTPPWNQGQQGSCGAQSAAGDLLYDQEQTPSPDTVPSRAFIYYTTRELMGTTEQDSGVYNRELCKAVAQFGWPPESLMPYNDREYRTKPSPAVYAEAFKRAGGRYERVTQSLDQMRGAIAQGDPFVFGFNWYDQWGAEQDRTGDLTVTTRTARVLGGHDVVICGYDDATQRFQFRNSWGAWGNRGYGTIPYTQAVDPKKSSDFWTLHVDEVPLPPDPPIPVPVPVPGLTRYTITFDSPAPPVVSP